MCSFNNVLPRWKINGIHIKVSVILTGANCLENISSEFLFVTQMEDDCPQGNDETRIFVLTSLGDQKMREVECLLCRTSLPVYDRYPLVDGTFFLSPLNHAGIGIKVSQKIFDRFGRLLTLFWSFVIFRSFFIGFLTFQVKHDGKDGYLLSVCVVCLENSNQLKCLRCGSVGWFPGDRLVLGTLYMFDVLASTVCCSPVCTSCRNPVPVPQSHYFSTFSDPTVCPHCGHADLHFIRRLENVRRVNSATA